MNPDLKTTYDNIAEHWHRDHQEDSWWREGVLRFIGLMPSSALVLDVGCGAGTKATYMIDRGLKVIGIDFSEKMIAIAKREVKTGTFLVMDASEIAEIPEMFDGIFMEAFLLHVKKQDVEGMLRKALSRLKENGYLYVSVKEKMPDGPEEEMKEEEKYGQKFQRFFSYFIEEEMKTLFGKVGLTAIYSSVTPSGKTRWLSVVGRKGKKE